MDKGEGRPSLWITLLGDARASLGRNGVSDYHLHIHPHRDVPGAPPPGEFPADYIDRYVEVALSRGSQEVAFVEHLYRCVESVPVLGKWWKNDPNPHLVKEMDEIMARELDMSLDKYVEAILAAKARGLPVKLGLEVDYEPGTAQKVIDLIKPYPWDFIVGSVHWIGAWWFLRPSGPAEYAAPRRAACIRGVLRAGDSARGDGHGRQARARRRHQGRGHRTRR